MKAFIECGICKKSFECKLSESPDSCAKRYKMFVLTFVDTSTDYSESIFVCRECFSKHLEIKIFNRCF